jgi:hypothetical protein
MAADTAPVLTAPRAIERFFRLFARSLANDFPASLGEKVHESDTSARRQHQGGESVTEIIPPCRTRLACPRSPYRSYAYEITNSRAPAQDLDDDSRQTSGTELPLDRTPTRMAVATRLSFCSLVPLLVAVAMAASTRAQANGADPFAPSRSRSPQAFALASTLSRAAICDTDQAKQRLSASLEPRGVALEPQRPVILDGVLYLENMSRSGAAGSRKPDAASSCSAYLDTRDLEVIHRRIDSPRYY